LRIIGDIPARAASASVSASESRIIETCAAIDFSRFDGAPSRINRRSQGSTNGK
jgi:hypothetical protein